MTNINNSAKNAVQHLLNVGNVVAAAIGLGASVTLAFLVPQIYDVLTGAVAITLVLAAVVSIYRRINPTTTDDTTGR